ncbi:2,4-dienoyl-CoA reductase [Rhodococcus sp. ACPA1]|nr:2,4-dienoyl-CoA reductase [Rhodococcus sp. ACPA1]
MVGNSKMRTPFVPGLLAGSAAIVTGGGSGIGRQIALGLAECGARVVVSGRRRDVLDDVCDQIQGIGGEAIAATCDVRDPESVAALVASAEDAVGPIDLLVNNAGATFTCPSEELTPNGFRAVVETDAFGTFYTCQEFGRRVIARGTGGAILNITSTSPFTGNPGRIHGGVGKAGVESLTKSLAVEWGPHDIRVNALAPGYTPTAGVDRATGVSDNAVNDDLQRLADSVPLGRVGTVDEIAWPAVFLLSPAASFINGAVIVVDGGKWLSSGRRIGGAQSSTGTMPSPN